MSRTWESERLLRVSTGDAVETPVPIYGVLQALDSFRCHVYNFGEIQYAYAGELCVLGASVPCSRGARGRE